MMEKQTVPRFRILDEENLIPDSNEDSGRECEKRQIKVDRKSSFKVGRIVALSGIRNISHGAVHLDLY